MEYYLALKINEIIPFAATQMDNEIIILAEGRQRKTNISLKWYKWTYLQYMNRLTEFKNKFTVIRGDTRWVRDELEDWD